MATKNEKIVCAILGIGIGVYIADSKEPKEESNNNFNNSLWHILKGAFWGGLSGYGLAMIFGSPNDTINYTHYYNGKRVYEGITYKDRFEKRMKEHIANGKIFTKVVKDKPKPRVEAIKLEKENIIKYKPINNIQFNKK